MNRATLAVLLAVVLALPGCAVREWWLARGETGPEPDLSRGVEVVSQEAVLAFQERAQAFYDRLSLRRFNTFATYNDVVLREHFRSDEAFYDYYADLAHALDEADFQRSRAVVAEVKEFAIDEPGRARVVIRMRGDNAQALRYWTIVLEREDVWERAEGVWWVVPSKL